MTAGIPQLTEEFRSGLELLDMYVPERPESSGLVLSEETPLNEYEYIALEKARKYNVTGVYFRRFETGRAPVPQVYIYDFTQKSWDEDEVGELQRRLWNSGQVPLFFIFTKTEIKIFNCLQKPKRKKGKFISSPLEIIKLAAKVEDELKEFSARKFDNGSFWETSKYKDNFKLSESSYETLLSNLKAVRNDIINDIIKENILDKEIVQKLLVMTILVKYLEERKDEDGNTVFPGDFFSRFAPGAKKFTDVLKEKGACLDLFDYLGKHFNGEIFAWLKKEEREKISQTDLKPFANFLEGMEDDTGQRSFWPLYSFNDLPIELISNIYEEFLGDKAGVVYTPPYLVNFLIDEAMPISETKNDFKVLDPACGSGVFLVAAYKRIIDWWRISNNWDKPDKDTLKKLLRENIFGVDIDHDAVRLTIFSLSLVLFDALSPKVIWEKLKFDNLKSSDNLFDKDFFELISNKQLLGKFDLVIGNPPFIENLTTDAAVKLEAKQLKKRVKIPENQLSLLFLEQSMAACKPGGLLCLILPSGPFLYNNNSIDFRKYFIRSYNVKQVLDFSSLSPVLFSSAKVATAAAFVVNEKPELKAILHVTFKRTKSVKEKLYFELDHYDFHYISYKEALNNKLIWKCNLLGGGRLTYLISKLTKLKKFGDYLKEKVSNDGWKEGEGFILSNKKDIKRLEYLEKQIGNLSQKQKEEFKELKKECETADFLTNKKTLPVQAFTENGIDESMIRILEEKYFRRRREKEIYNAPHLLIKEVIGKRSIPIILIDEHLSFKNSIIGIHAPNSQIGELQDIEKRIKNNKIYLFFVALHSGRYLINKASSLLKGDIENLPYPENEQELELTEIEEILVDDVLEYMLDFHRNGEKSTVLKPVNEKQLVQFGEIYCRILNSVYKKFKPYRPIETDSYICFPFYYEEKPQILTGNPYQFEKNLNQILNNEVSRNLRMVRVLRFYDQKIIYLVKPKQLRYWLRSTAVRDADETFSDLVEQGY